jgi:hypothetical protein
MVRSFGELARATGLEPATPGVTGRYSNRLSYARAVLRAALESLSKAGVIPLTLVRVKRSMLSLCRRLLLLLSARQKYRRFGWVFAQMAGLTMTTPCT